MVVASRVSRYIQSAGFRVRQYIHDRADTLHRAASLAGIRPQTVVSAELWIDARGVLMTLVPLGQATDAEKLARATGRHMQRLTCRQAQQVFKDCEPGSLPPFAGAYGLPHIADIRIAELDEVVVQSGCHTTLLGLSGESLSRWRSGVRFVDLGLPIVPQDDASDKPGSDDSLRKLYQLPPMPEVAQQILAQDEERVSIREMGELIGRDPSLSAQIMREAASARYGYRGKLDTIDQAVSRVLGMDRVRQLAFALAAGAAFDIPREGRLGLDAFWVRSLQVADLCKSLAEALPRADINPGKAYLAGLLHDFGWLVMGHLFKPEYRAVARQAERCPELPLQAIEEATLGLSGGAAKRSHTNLGASLLAHWQLPTEIVSVAAQHHQSTVVGPHQDYVHLVQLAEAILDARKCPTEGAGQLLESIPQERLAALIGRLDGSEEVPPQALAG